MTTLVAPNNAGRLTEEWKSPKAIVRKLELASRSPHLTGYVWAGLRLSMGWIFLWAFLDKLIGLGFATEAGKGWIDGGSPAAGFLSFGTSGPLAGFYSGLAGNAVVDWMFMLGILAIGLPLVLGIGVRIAASIGVVMLLVMYSALLGPANNPFLDDHIIYALIMLGLVVNPGNHFTLAGWWGKTKLVKMLPVLK